MIYLRKKDNENKFFPYKIFFLTVTQDVIKSGGFTSFTFLNIRCTPGLNLLERKVLHNTFFDLLLNVIYLYKTGSSNDYCLRAAN